jgi:hypothetical protein
MCDGLHSVGVLLRLWAIPGTLEPLRALTALADLSVSTNALIGMFTITHGKRGIPNSCFLVHL